MSVSVQINGVDIGAKEITIHKSTPALDDVEHASPNELFMPTVRAELAARVNNPKAVRLLKRTLGRKMKISGSEWLPKAFGLHEQVLFEGAIWQVYRRSRRHGAIYLRRWYE